MTGTLRIVTWNVQGANLATNRRKLRIYLKQKRADIAPLQETHLDTRGSKKLQKLFTIHSHPVREGLLF